MKETTTPKEIATEHILDLAGVAFPLGEVEEDIGCHHDWEGIDSVAILHVCQAEDPNTYDIKAKVGWWRSDENGRIDATSIIHYFVEIADGEIGDVTWDEIETEWETALSDEGQMRD